MFIVKFFIRFFFLMFVLVRNGDEYENQRATESDIGLYRGGRGLHGHLHPALLLVLQAIRFVFQMDRRLQAPTELRQLAERPNGEVHPAAQAGTRDGGQTERYR